MTKKDRFGAVCCAFVLLTYIVIAVLGALECLPDFQERVGVSYEPPSLQLSKLCGTDLFGRSILFKVLAGCKTATLIGALVCLFVIPLGTLSGALAGYFGGKIDLTIVWICSVVATVPGILLIITVTYTLGKGILALCIAISTSYWVRLCRVVRGECIKQRGFDYVAASISLGLPSYKIILFHILPNIQHIVVASSSLIFLGSIKYELLLTFLGLGIKDGSSWGLMIAESTEELANGVWWPLSTVVLFMFLIVYSVNALAHLVQDANDPRFYNKEFS